MKPEAIKQQIQALPEAAIWPDLLEVFERTEGTPHPDWELPLLACLATGGDEAAAAPVAAAVACAQISIMLVDDMLDNDPRGEHNRRGSGAAANLALAFQAAAFRLLRDAPLSDKQRAALANTLARMALATAAGQQLDTQNLTGEENYWRVVEAKSTPFYGATFELGAIAGGAGPQVTASLYELGKLIGEMIQIEDDLDDALATPANADWREGRNNLLILYALTTDHPQRERFEVLLPATDDLAALDEAQAILGSSGAVSYAVYLLLARYQAARGLLATIDLPNPQPLQRLLDDYAGYLSALLRQAGIDASLEGLL